MKINSNVINQNNWINLILFYFASRSKTEIFQLDPYSKIFGDILDHWSTTDDSEDDDKEKFYKLAKYEKFIFSAN